MESSNDTSFSHSLTWLLEIALACSVIVYLLQLWWNRKWTIYKGQLPPGSMGYFGVGESLQLVANQHQFFIDRDKKYGNIYKTHILGNPTVQVMGEYAKKVLHGDSNTINNNQSKNAWELLGPSSVTCLTGEEHKHVRTDIMNVFKKDNLEYYIPRIYAIMERELHEWCGEDKVLVHKRMKRMTFEAAWEVIVGLPLRKEEINQLADQFHTFVLGLFSPPLNIPGFPYYKALHAKKVLHAYIEKAIGLGDSLSPNSVLGMILQLKNHSGVGYSTEQIQELTTELLAAGSAPVASAATSLLICLERDDNVKRNLMREMIENEIMDKDSTLKYDCLNKMDYLNGIIKEVLRVCTPVAGVFRTAKRSFQLGNYTIPEGWNIIPGICGTIRQGAFEDRRKFKPERWHKIDQSATEPNYIPFGAGPRSCVGKEYAKVFLHVFAICLVQRCHVELLSESTKQVRRPILEPKDHLPARFVYRE